MDLFLPAVVALNRRSSRRSARASLRHVDGRHSRGARTVRGRLLVSVVTPSVLFRDTSAASAPLLTAPAPDVGLPITWGATRVARCAGESDERGSPSSSFRRVAG